MQFDSFQYTKLIQFCSHEVLFLTKMVHKLKNAGLFPAFILFNRT